MGQRNRHGEKTIARAAKLKMAEAMKKFTRATALKELALGADPSEDRFTKHANYHVRARAWRKMGMPLPDDPVEVEKFLKSIHTSPEKVAGFIKTGDETPQTEEQSNG